MSTNKTQNYHLHSWVPGDKFLRAEINENFIRLDSAAWVATGTYVGDDQATRFISLGFTPRAVLVVNDEGQMGSSASNTRCKGGLVAPGMTTLNGLLNVAEGGFEVHDRATYVSTNSHTYTYCYIAVR